MTNKGKTEQHILERICPICGKNFVLAPEHIYRDGTKKVCGWNCQCEAERRKEAKKAKRMYRGKPVDPKRNEKICLLAASGVKTSDIAKEFDLTVSHVNRIISGSKCVK